MDDAEFDGHKKAMLEMYQGLLDDCPQEFTPISGGIAMCDPSKTKTDDDPPKIDNRAANFDSLDR